MFNIVVIGLAGSGKSSLINSVEQAVVGTPANLARVGRGAGGNVTLCIEGCKMFSTLEDKLRDKVTFRDFVGLPNRNDETIRTLISLALDGRIPENQPLINPEYFEMCKEELEDEFPATQDGPKIHRVVVVCAADEEIPVNLLKATKMAAQPATTASDRNIPLFLFVSKVDKMVGEANERDLSRRVQSARDTLDATNDFFQKATLYHEQTNQVNDPASVDTFRDGFDYLPAKFHQWVDDPEAHVLVAEADDKMLAVSVCFATDGGAHLFSKTLRIAPELQRKRFLMGIGFEVEKALQLRLHPWQLQLERHAVADVKRPYLWKGVPKKTDICFIARCHVLPRHDWQSPGVRWCSPPSLTTISDALPTFRHVAAGNARVLPTDSV
ncbi:Hypp6033 [Branchiostoma lanceolatum]|uniref:Hypp6033 protein n=1 Tax=Branchiostoma lanceolatum TaxID=7740 RepID=A0A8J9W8I6_BRALA|nr:Hypp6033 [Branchiostoma lanceolatum]